MSQTLRKITPLVVPPEATLASEANKEGDGNDRTSTNAP